MADIETGRDSDEGYDVKIDDANPDAKTADRVITALRKLTKKIGDRAAERR